MERPEIVIGLVGALGTELEAVSISIQKILSELNYKSIEVKPSALLRDLPNGLINIKLIEEPARERLQSYMDAGNDLRKQMNRGDALSRLVVTAIRDKRYGLNDSISDEEERSNKPLNSHAFIIRSLKHPDEVKMLRKVYGPSFFLISAYAPRQARQENLARRLSSSQNRMRPEGFEGAALELIERDEEELGDPLGQHVRKTFWRGDAHVDARDIAHMETDIRRLVQIWFGHPFHTPTPDEYMMFCAQATAYRSASMGRQVGAIIASPDGTILATGANEVPKAGGGQYWHGDANDARDHVSGHDSSDVMRHDLLGDILRRLMKLEHMAEKNVNQLVEELLYGDNPIMQAAEFNALTEFQRPVHAEMAAITEAARRGVSIAGATLFATTFPCHGCARHIVASGIKRVVYIEPYVKSLARTLHSDSISIDQGCINDGRVQFEPFVGLAPSRYMEFFPMGQRKDDHGKAVVWNGNSALPRVGYWSSLLSQVNEQSVATQVMEWSEQKNVDKIR
jgi:deoxycytidylate deaminase